MKVALLQIDIKTGDTRANLERLQAIIPSDVDLVVMPEMFHCGFTHDMGAISAEDSQLTLNWLRSVAKSKNVTLCGSVAWRVDESSARNRLFCVTPSGDVVHYDKRHLFSMGNEHAQFVAGTERTIINVGGMRLLLQVCYDLRFPVWSRNRGDYDVAVYVANWPSARKDAWLTLLKARAIENQCYVLGVNRVGTCEGIAYKGNTIVFGPRGEVVAEAQSAEEEIVMAELNNDMLQNFRAKFRVLDDADDFTINDN